MINNATAFLAGVFFLVFSVSLVQADSSLPDTVPDDFPFPDDANLRVQDSTSASMVQVVVSFSFESDPDELYAGSRSYAVENGYEVSSENEAEYSFTSTHYSSGKSISVRLSEMESLNIGIVTFTGPN